MTCINTNYRLNAKITGTAEQLRDGETHMALNEALIYYMISSVPLPVFAAINYIKSVPRSFMTKYLAHELHRKIWDMNHVRISNEILSNLVPL